MRPGQAMRTRDLVRLSYGVALLVDPQRCSIALTGTRLDRPGRVTARVLGARQVLQAVVLMRDGRTRVRRASRAVDLLHAGSMLVLAAWSPSRTRTATTDAVVAALFAGPSPSPRGPRPAPPLEHAPAPSPTSGPDLLDLPAPARPRGVDTPQDEDADTGPRARRQRDADRQSAVYEAFTAGSGGSPRQARVALVRALDARGLPLPPPAWLDAVAADIAAGNIYVVSGPAMQDVGLQLPPHEPL